MTFQRTLNVGDIITIKGRQILHLVIHSERRNITKDGIFYVDEIGVVTIAMDRWGKPSTTIQYTDPKIDRFYFEGGPHKGEGRPLKDSDVKVVGTSHLTTYTTTQVMEGVHYYGNL